MNIFRKVTWETLKKNRVRTIVTIIGIILSTSMFTAVTTSISSIRAYMIESCMYQKGDYHGAYLNLPADEMNDFVQDEEVESAAFAQNIGYAAIGSQNAYKPYLFVMGADELFLDRMPVHLTSGRLPDNSNEIILPDHLFSNGCVEYHIGDTLTLQLGDRYYGDEKLDQSSGYWPEEEESPGETLEIRETRTYTVTGFYKRPDFEYHESPGYTAITLWDSSRPTETAAAYFRLTHPQTARLFASTLEGTTSLNTSLLRYEGAFGSESMQTVLYLMGAVLISLIMFGSVSLIYNAFSISVSERTKQFGLLSSVGATRRQIRQMVLEEAFDVSIVGIPLGIISGILGIGITFHFVGDKFYVLYGIEEVALHLVVSPAALIAAAVVAFLTVLISAWIPSRRATRVTAIEAIRQSEDINIRAEQVKTSPVVQKLFGLEGTLAGKHFKRNRRRYRATVISLFASVVLFIAASSFCRYLNDLAVGVLENYDYDIRCRWTEFETDRGETYSLEQAAENLAATEGVACCSAVREYSADKEISWNQIPEETREKLQKEYEEDSVFPLMVRICGIDSRTYETYLKKTGLSVSGFDETAWKENGGHEPSRFPGIVMAETNTYNSTSQRYEKNMLLEDSMKTLTLQTLDLEIGAFVDSLPFGLNQESSNTVFVVYPMEVFRSMEPLFEDDGAVSEMIYFKTTDHRTGMENLKQTAKENGIPENWLYDVSADYEENENLVIIIRVFSYGFIILISLISLANVFNTISTGILLRRREFAMLRSVGMTEKGINRMLSYECMLYGGKALLYGLPVSFGITWVIFRIVMNVYDTGFYLPWTSVMIAVGSVFFVVFATMLYARGKIKRENLIDALKNENY
ncbi:MAG: ABC transporter permease [Lachnospiraceae bacterium]|nr:ABC transporter permease [Lachnospiraceae bacterium]